MEKELPDGEEAVGTKLLKKPPARGWQGLAKEDWTTEWFCGRDVLVILCWFAGGEGGAYLGVEVELYGGADCYLDVIGGKREAACADGDFEGCSRLGIDGSCAEGGEAEESAGEIHARWLE